MGDSLRWTREFSTKSSFADDLGALGAWVGPRTGIAKRTQGQMEDYVLRRVLVALRRQGELDFPLVVRATDDLPQACPFELEREVLLEDWFPSSITRKGG